MTLEMIVLIMGQIMTAGAIYGGIRSDIKNLHECALEAKKDAEKAHERIDRLIERRAQ